MTRVAPELDFGRRWWLVAAIVALACLRLVHRDLLWSDEDYHLAAGFDVLLGKIPYRDFWYDKPPLDALYYVLIGAHAGWPLRLLDGAYVCVAAWLAWRLAACLWSEVEGWLAAFLLAFFLAFYLPAGVIPFAADALLIVPHLAAVLAVEKRSFRWAGVWSGLGFLLNTKGAFVLASCAVWAAGGAVWVCAGFAIPVLLGMGALLALGAWPGYVEQVWRWGLIYARSSPQSSLLSAGLRRVLDWAGFHSALVVGAGWGVRRNWRMVAWIGFSFASVCVGGRFVPRYFLQLLPPLVVAGARGIAVCSRRYPRYGVIAFAALLCVPLIRFGPRYMELTFDPLPKWADVGMDEDSRDVARDLAALKKPGDTLFVWGYRPDVYVYTRMTPDGLFWDSQPLTGVPADRHLSVAQPVFGTESVANRKRLVASHPTFVVDGLGVLNPNLAPQKYAEIRTWLESYQQVGRTELSIIYRRKS